MYRSVVTRDPQTDQGTARLRLIELPVVAGDDWSVLGVLGRSPITHTVGLYRRDLPEFLVRGLPPHLGAGVVRFFAQQAGAGVRFRHGQVVLGNNRDELPLTLIRVLDRSELVTVRRHCPDAEVLQIVWPDLNQFFPWQAGYAPGPEAQPVHGTPAALPPFPERAPAPIIPLGDRIRR